MIALTAAEAGDALGLGSGCLPVTGVSTDTRTLAPGDLFVALSGDSFDGHAFVPAAFAAGASAAVVERRSVSDRADGWSALAGPLYPVVDTRLALGALARAVRRKSGATVLAVTGSVGKTGTKDLLRASIGRARRVVATAANQNNEIGVPLTLLSITSDTEVVVVEMGMRGRGQIGSLCEIAEPDVGLITRIAPVHLELVGDMQGVATAKGELFRGLRPTGTAVFPVGEPLLEEQAAGAGRRIVRFAFERDEAAHVKGSIVVLEDSQATLELQFPEGRLEVEVPFSARHRLENAVAAMAACYAAGLPTGVCAPGLADVHFTPLRGDEHRVGDMLLLDDCYNANPAAVMGAIDDLIRRAGLRSVRPVAVLGDMLELGGAERRFHREVGEHAASAGVGMLVGVGPLSAETVRGYVDRIASLGEAGRGGEALHVPDLDTGMKQILARMRGDDAVLVKASRSMKLERVVAELRKGAA